MTWQEEYDNLFGDNHHKICEGKNCQCHIEVKQFISNIIDQTREETLKELIREYQDNELDGKGYDFYFSIRAKQFDSDIMCHGKERVKNKMKEIDLAGNTATNKDQEMYPVLELVLEMYERGIKFLPIDLYKSHSINFLMEEEGIRPPLSAIPGFGQVDAENVIKVRDDGKFMSIDDLKIRARVGKVALETLKTAGVLEGMSQSNQLSLFG